MGGVALDVAGSSPVAVHDDLVPRGALLEGFTYAGARIGVGSLYKGIHRNGETPLPGT